MKKYVFTIETVDEMERTINDIDVCLYLDELHRNFGKNLCNESSMCSAEDVSNYISDRLYGLVEDFRALVSECDTVEEVRLKVS